MGFDADFKNWKTEYLGLYCMTKCNKTCCDMQNVSLHVDEHELKKIFDEKIDPKNYKELGIRKVNEKGMVSIETKSLCRKFDSSTRKCLIYDRRPVSCREYPFLVDKGGVVIKGGCSLDKGDPAYEKLVEITTLYKKVIVKRTGK